MLQRNNEEKDLKENVKKSTDFKTYNKSTTEHRRKKSLMNKDYFLYLKRPVVYI